MSNSEYEKIIKEGVRVDWYGESVPEELLSPKIRFWCDNLLEEIHKLEGELSDLKGTPLEKRKNYLKSLWNSVKKSPYTLNGDFYLQKKTRFEKEIGKKEEKPTKKRKTTVKKPTPKAKTTSDGGSTTTKKGSTRNGGIIFGKK